MMNIDNPYNLTQVAATTGRNEPSLQPSQPKAVEVGLYYKFSEFEHQHHYFDFIDAAEALSITEFKILLVFN